MSKWRFCGPQLKDNLFMLNLKVKLHLAKYNYKLISIPFSLVFISGQAAF